MELCSLPVIYLGPNYSGDNEDNGNLLQQVPCRHCYTQRPQPCSRPPLTHASTGDSWTLMGQSLVGSLLLSPQSWCTQGSVCALQDSVSQSCVSSGSCMMGLMATSSKKTYVISKPRVPVPVADHCQPVPPQEMLKHSSVSVSVESLGCGVHKVCLSSLSVSVGSGVLF